MIYNALLKKGYSNFTLEILEYCDSADLLKREQYYIDKWNPEYNILKTAGSSLGFKHSDETRTKISNSLAGERNPMFGLKHSDEIIAKISNSLAGERNPMFGKTGSKNPRFGKQHSSETRAKISIFKAGKPRPQGAGKSSQPVEVIDIKNNIKTRHDSISAAALALGIKPATISKYFSNNQKKPYNSQYVFCRRYSSLSQSLAIMKHTKCNHKCVEKQNTYLSSWLLNKVLSLKQWAKDIISGFFLRTGDLLSLVIGINNLALKVVNAIIFIQVYLYNLYIQYLSKGDGVIVVQTQNSLEGSQETVLFGAFRAGKGKTLHSICQRAKLYDYNSYNTIHLNTQNIRIQNYATSPVVPIKIYANTETQKSSIIKENVGKSGVYRWVNIVNGKIYIGSSVNLSTRFKQYYNIKYISLYKMPIYKALLKYGYLNFSLEILEYCDQTQCIEREQDYLDLLKPEYNILKTAGSLLGFKHSEESLSKISNALTGEKNPMSGKLGENSHMFGRQISEQTRAKLSIAFTGEKNPRYGKPKPEGSGSPSIKIKVFDILTNTSTIYNSMSETAKALNCPSSSISGYFSRKRQTPFKKRYLLENSSNKKSNFSTIYSATGGAGGGKTLHSIPLLGAKISGYNPDNSIHLNSQKILVRSRGTQKQNFSTSPDLPSLHPWFITGFTDAEGCFMINILKEPKMKVGWRVQPVFQIGLHVKDENLLKEIKVFFEDQGFFTKLNNNSLIYRIYSIEMLEKVINHFENYPLQTKKRADFELFKSVVMLVKSKKHLSIEGLHEIVNHRASLNNGLTSLLKESFPKYCPVARISDIANHQNLDSQWLAGFTAGEGSFNVNISRNSRYKTGYLVTLRFQLSQHLRDEKLLISLIDYFGCGQYYSLKDTHSRGDFVVTKLSDILNIIIPFYLKNPLVGLKAYDFQLWCKISEIMLKKEHLTLEGLEKIREIKTKMNKCAISSSSEATNSFNNISIKNLIAILSSQSIYIEVLKLINSNVHLIKYMSSEDKQILKDKSSTKLDEIIKSLKDWTYSSEPLYIKTTELQKFKSLVMPSLKDIILQTAIKLLLESYCEKQIFNSQSFGFRSNKSIHHALASVKKMKGVTWILKGRINNFFDNINYNILVNIIKDKLNPDRTLMGIFNKLFKVGSLVNPFFDIISPILFNIYLTPLDEFIDKLKESYARSPTHKCVAAPAQGIYYVRFANEWVLGMEAPPGDEYNNELVQIRGQIKTFIRDRLKLELEKNKLTHLVGSKNYADFLGHYLGCSNTGSGAQKNFKDLLNYSLLIIIPYNKLKSKLIEKGFADDFGNPKYVGKLLHLSDYEIVKYYNRFFTRILIFYGMADKCSGLREVFYILEYSLAHTLAAKHRSSLSKVFKKYGKPIVVNSAAAGKVRFTNPKKYLNKKFNAELEMWKLEYDTKDPISILSKIN